MNVDRQANIIKFAAICTAIPRWAGALLASEGFQIPDAWLGLWVPMSALLAVGMAITEALAFSFIFSAWRNQTDKRANRLLSLAVLSAITFVFVLSPYVGSRVRDVTIDQVLTNDVVFWMWTTAVGLSTITIVLTVGYAQKVDAPRAATQRRKAAVAKEFGCWCGETFATVQARSGHTKRHKNEIGDAQTVPNAVLILQELYPGRSVRPSIIRKLRKDFANEANNKKLEEGTSATN